MVVAKLVERSLPTQLVRGSNPVIGKMFVYGQLNKFENKYKGSGYSPMFQFYCYNIESV